NSWPTRATTPAFAAASRMRRASTASMAKGFSQITWRPASTASMARAACSAGGVAMETTSTPGMARASANDVHACGTPRRWARRAVFSASRPTMAATSNPALRRAGTCTRPPKPVPTTTARTAIFGTLRRARHRDSDRAAEDEVDAVVDLAAEVPGGQAVEEVVEPDRGLEPGQVDPQAVVEPEAEAEMVLRRAARVELRRARPPGGVAVGRAEQAGDGVAERDGHAAHLGALGPDRALADLGHRFVPQDLFEGGGDAGALGDQRPALVGVAGQGDERVRHPLGGRFVAGEHQLGVVGHDLGLAHGAGDGRRDHLADQVVARAVPALGHLIGDVGVELLGGLEPGAEDLAAPLGRVEQRAGDGTHGVAPVAELALVPLVNPKQHGDDPGGDGAREVLDGIEGLAVEEPRHELIGRVVDDALGGRAVPLEPLALEVGGPDTPDLVVARA